MCCWFQQCCASGCIEAEPIGKKKQKPGFTDLESACTGPSAGKGIGKQGRKPDPESAVRGFKIPEMTWWREALDYRQLIKMGLAGGSHQFKPLRWTLVTLSHLWGKTTPTRTRGRRPRNVLILLERGQSPAMMSKLAQAQGRLNCYRKFYWRRCYVDNGPMTCIYFFILLNWMNFPQCSQAPSVLKRRGWDLNEMLLRQGN